MRAVDLILKKRRGSSLTTEEIAALIDGYTHGRIPDYQMAAFLMAVCFRGMDAAETAALTEAMVRSGTTVDLAGIRGPRVDKHSTGGVGDKTSLVLGPLLASVDLVVAKMSGRGLGHTGGTLDKLESLEGFRVDLSREEFADVVNRHGLAIVSQTADLVPADKQLYGLRDVTGTIDSVPLIAASIMSKKLAVATEALVLDVKTGSGAFMKELSDARALAVAMVRIGQAFGRQVRAVITDMEQPLGRRVGNALEVEEAVETLRGGGPPDLRELVIVLATQAMLATGRASTEAQARATLAARLADGAAFERFRRFVQAQGGQEGAWDRLPRAAHHAVVESPTAGYVVAIDCEGVGRAAMKLGAGRETKGSPIDLAVGLTVHRRLGDRVSAGDALFTVHHNDPGRLSPCREELEAAVRIGECPPAGRPLVFEVVAA